LNKYIHVYIYMYTYIYIQASKKPSLRRLRQRDCMLSCDVQPRGPTPSPSKRNPLKINPARLYNTLHHIAADCNTLQHNAIHCSTLRQTATHGKVGFFCNRALHKYGTFSVKTQVTAEAKILGFFWRHHVWALLCPLLGLFCAL